MSLFNKQAGNSGVLGRIKQEATVMYDKCQLMPVELTYIKTVPEIRASLCDYK